MYWLDFEDLRAAFSSLEKLVRSTPGQSVSESNVCKKPATNLCKKPEAPACKKPESKKPPTKDDDDDDVDLFGSASEVKKIPIREFECILCDNLRGN